MARERVARSSRGRPGAEGAGFEEGLEDDHLEGLLHGGGLEIAEPGAGGGEDAVLAGVEVALPCDEVEPGVVLGAERGDVGAEALELAGGGAVVAGGAELAVEAFDFGGAAGEEVAEEVFGFELDVDGAAGGEVEGGAVFEPGGEGGGAGCE